MNDDIKEALSAILFAALMVGMVWVLFSIPRGAF